jgi:hypothetical protein
MPWGSGGIAPPLTSVLEEVSGQLHASAALPLRKSPPVPIELDAGWAPGLVCVGVLYANTEVGVE